MATINAGCVTHFYVQKSGEHYVSVFTVENRSLSEENCFAQRHRGRREFYLLSCMPLCLVWFINDRYIIILIDHPSVLRQAQYKLSSG
jgi:hypothetical protein